jgi:hypothetical protein
MQFLKAKIQALSEHTGLPDDEEEDVDVEGGIATGKENNTDESDDT